MSIRKLVQFILLVTVLAIGKLVNKPDEIVETNVRGHEINRLSFLTTDVEDKKIMTSGLNTLPEKQFFSEFPFLQVGLCCPPRSNFIIESKN